MEGGLLGYPILDSAPYGLDHHREDTTHVFRELNVALPRGELARRAESRKSQTAYFASAVGDVANAADDGVRYMTEESCWKLHEAAVALAHLPMAIVDAEAFSLAPGGQAVAPCRWDKVVPLHDFGCASLEMLGSKMGVLPGV